MANHPGFIVDRQSATKGLPLGELMSGSRYRRHVTARLASPYRVGVIFEVFHRPLAPYWLMLPP